MRVIGLTGGIGTGKSTVAAYLRGKGIPVVDADAIGREVTADGSPHLGAIRDALGDGVFRADGSLDRRAVSARIFADAKARAAYEAIVTQRIKEICLKRLQVLEAAGERLAVVDAPLLFESGFDRYVDETWVVEAPLSLRLARVTARDGVEEAEVLARIRAQMDDGERDRRATHVLRNDGDVASLYAAVDELLAR